VVLVGSFLVFRSVEISVIINFSKNGELFRQTFSVVLCVFRYYSSLIESNSWNWLCLWISMCTLKQAKNILCSFKFGFQCLITSTYLFYVWSNLSVSFFLDCLKIFELQQMKFKFFFQQHTIYYFVHYFSYTMWFFYIFKMENDDVIAISKKACNS
jgi:hypothetical protein